MSVRINPCHGCFLRHAGNAECDATRAKIVKSVANIGLRSATFDCAVLASFVKIGARIVIWQPSFGPSDWGDEYGGYVEKKKVSATITSANSGGRFACVVDKGQIDEDELSAAVRDKNMVRFRKTMRHTRIVRFLDEPPRKICEFGNVIGDDGKCDCASGECACGRDFGKGKDNEH